MSRFQIRAVLLSLVAALAVSVGGAQPPGDKKNEPKPKEPKPSSTADSPLPPWPTLPANAPPIRKLQFEQLQEGLSYLDKLKEVIRLGSADTRLMKDYANMTLEVYGLAAELEDKPAKRIPWFEARVRRLKELEQVVERSVRAGIEPARSSNLARFARLQAEIDLLRLKADVEKAGGK